jgi:hypothetical protein
MEDAVEGPVNTAVLKTVGNGEREERRKPPRALVGFTEDMREGGAAAKGGCQDGTRVAHAIRWKPVNSECGERVPVGSVHYGRAALARIIDDHARVARKTAPKRGGPTGWALSLHRGGFRPLPVAGVLSLPPFLDPTTRR